MSARPMGEGPGHPGWKWLFVASVVLSAMLGLVMTILGAQVAWLGGTIYFLLAGAVLLSGGLLIVLKRYRLALLAAGLAVIFTLVWSIAEIHGKGWLPAWGFDLAARMGLITLLAGLAAIGFVFWRSPPGALWRKGTVGLVAVFGLSAILLVALYWERTQEPASRTIAAASSVGSEPPAADAGSEWGAFGGTTEGRRYSTLAQIDTSNVTELKEAWSFRGGDTPPPAERIFYSSQNTPLKIGDLLYTCTASSQVFALDPATGEVRWHYDPRVPRETMESLFSVACRAVAYHAEDDAGAAPQPLAARSGSACRRRVYVATPDGRMIALDALGGYLCPDFAAGGVLDLNEGMGLRKTGFASNTSGATVAGGLLIVGQQVSDNQRRDAPSGVVRAYDARSGELRWAWDALRPDAQARLTPGEIYPRGTPNVWNVISADESLGLAFLGTGNPGADHWGAIAPPRRTGSPLPWWQSIWRPARPAGPSPPSSTTCGIMTSAPSP